MRHCRDVLRCRPGERIVLFDGAGRSMTGVISRIDRDSVVIEASGPSTLDSDLPAIVLATAIPKGKNMDWIVQRATELGATVIVPLLTHRTVVRIDSRETKKKQEKWQRVSLEACKQCGRNRLPLVVAPQSFDSFVPVAGADESALRLIATLSPQARPLREWLPGDSPPGGAIVLIGPEGDFTSDELVLASESGFQPLDLGRTILRAETAALCAVALLAYELDRPPPGNGEERLDTARA